MEASPGQLKAQSSWERPTTKGKALISTRLPVLSSVITRYLARDRGAQRRSHHSLSSWTNFSSWAMLNFARDSKKDR